MDFTWLIIPVAILLIIVLWYIATANKLKRAIIKIDEASSGIEISLTKRFDVLTKMLDVTKGYAAHEKEVMLETIKLRKGMTTGEMNTAAANISDAFGKINMVAEAYPELRSNENFKQLQLSIMDTEEHLQASRRLFNSNVTSYNMMIVTFPTSIVANKMALTKKDFFEAEEYKKQDVKMQF